MFRRGHLILLTVICAASFTVALAINQDWSHPPANQSFQDTWARSDDPVSSGQVHRTWLWGPAANTGSLFEEYADSPGGQRIVQYWDKSRMEINLPDESSGSSWFVTNGLLAHELMTGALQLGDGTFEHHPSAEIPVAGDPDDIGGPTYEAMGGLMDRAARVTGWGISQTIDRQGEITDREDLLGYGVRDEYYVPETGHNVASVFWEFMTSSGLIYQDGDYREGTLFPDPFYATGFPTTEGYWARVTVAGDEQDVLIQCFERRCLTYAPGNPTGWNVESSNTGQHYYRWRYEVIDRDAPADDQADDTTADTDQDSDDNGLTDDAFEDDAADDAGYIDDDGVADDPADDMTTDDGIADDDQSGDTGNGSDDDGASDDGTFEEATLEPGSIFIHDSGVAVGAPEGAISQPLELNVQVVEDPASDVPLPENWALNGMDIVSDLYAISADSSVETPYGNYLLVGIQVPQHVDPETLAFAALSPPGSVIAHAEIEPWMRWRTERGQYDAESGLFGTIVPSIGEVPQVYALITGSNYSEVEVPEEFGNPTIPPINLQEFLGFYVECAEETFVENDCTSEHRDQTADALITAHDAWVNGLEFAQPRLQHTVVDIVFSAEAPYFAALNMHDYLLAYSENPNGAYHVEAMIGVTFFPASAQHPDPDDTTTIHELFHAITFAYENLRNNYDNGLTPAAYEGTATAAEMSIASLTRSNDESVPGREPRHVDIGILRGLDSTDVHAYSSQDFWVFLGKRINPDDPQLDYMIPFFELGGLASDLDVVLANDQTFTSLSDAYWQWVKNQAFEKTLELGIDAGGNPVPHGESCSWSGLGNPEQFPVNPETHSVAFGKDLAPLTSHVYEVQLPVGADPYTALVELDTTEASHQNIEVKFYFPGEAGSDDCVSRTANHTHTFAIEQEAETAYVLVANTDAAANAEDLWIKYTIIQDAVFRAPDGQEWANFGESISTVGESVLIGAPRHDTSSGGDAGRAYLFDALGNHLQTLEAPDGRANAWFGWAVASTDHHILIGAPYHDVSASSWAVGQAYLFDAEGNYLQTFSPSTTESDTWFGFSVAITDETALIGAFEGDAFDGAGKVFKFELNGNLVRTLEAPGSTEWASFGSSLATDGEHILVGARNHPSGAGHGTGRAFIFNMDGDLIETLAPPEDQSHANFGWDVAIVEGSFLVGAPRQEVTQGSETGQAYLYSIDGEIVTTFDPPDPQIGSNFGSTVASTDDYILISAEQYNIDADSNAGQVYVFSYSGAYVETLRAPEPQTGSWFGRALASLDSRVLVGAHNHETDAGNFAGEAYLFVR